jgi:hypothetical protein
MDVSVRGAIYCFDEPETCSIEGVQCPCRLCLRTFGEHGDDSNTLNCGSSVGAVQVSKMRRIAGARCFMPLTPPGHPHGGDAMLHLSHMQCFKAVYIIFCYVRCASEGFWTHACFYIICNMLRTFVHMFPSTYL